ncbi:N-acetyltransferase [Shouchella shacheensis]|uniref:N-acetyltransferase n=1 Tax=Shouchella shacheensis TaxID=1649580 RepID=UPI0007400A11|nr:DapH/DapD/GlmU-related protein [Shouchella shacheensis]
MSKLPASIKIGHHVVIENEVVIGENVVIGDHTVIMNGTQLGDNVEIGANCVLGIQPGGNNRMRKTQNGAHKLIIGSGTKIGHLVSIYSGTVLSDKAFVGDHASIRENVSIGRETVVGRAAIVELNTTIGDNCTIQTLAYITGDTVLEDRVFIGPCVSMSNDKYMGAKEYTLKGPHIKEDAKIGNNASLLPGVTVGEKTIVGAGAVVTKDTGDQKVVAGVPARRIRSYY